MLNKNDRAKEIEKLIALRKKTTENGASKAEAMAAIDTFHKRMARFGFTLEEIESGEAAEAINCYEKSVYSGEGRFSYVDKYLWKTIAKFVGVLVGTGVDEDGDWTIRYYGQDAYVEEALRLRAMIKAAMAHEWEVHRDFVHSKGDLRTVKTSFHLGIADEVRERMEVRQHAHEASQDTSGTAIILKTWDIVVQKAKDAGFQEAVGGRGRSVQIDQSAYGAGRMAGARINLGRGVGGGSVKMIGK